jgi:hypothetical protein
VLISTIFIIDANFFRVVNFVSLILRALASSNRITVDRKGILLTRYASLLKNWLIDERQHVQNSSSWNPLVREDTGIVLLPENITQWERTSLSLRVSSPYRMIFSDFANYFESEMEAIDDYSLDQELAILNTLGSYR